MGEVEREWEVDALLRKVEETPLSMVMGVPGENQDNDRPRALRRDWPVCILYASDSVVGMLYLSHL